MGDVPHFEEEIKEEKQASSLVKRMFLLEKRFSSFIPTGHQCVIKLPEKRATLSSSVTEHVYVARLGSLLTLVTTR